LLLSAQADASSRKTIRDAETAQERKWKKKSACSVRNDGLRAGPKGKEESACSVRSRNIVRDANGASRNSIRDANYANGDGR